MGGERAGRWQNRRIAPPSLFHEPMKNAPQPQRGPDGLRLYLPDTGRHWQLDFAAMRRSGGGDLLLRALGSAAHGLRIVDATAGLGTDAWVLAGAGAQVELLERQPLLCQLLAEALGRARRSKSAAVAASAARMHLHPGDAVAWMRRLPSRARPQLVYLDPMFGTRRRKSQAAPRQAMQIVQALQGPQGSGPDAGLLAQALECATHRVLVKRPRGAPELPGPRPDGSVQGRLLRFDIYARRAMNTARNQSSMRSSMRS